VGFIWDGCVHVVWAAGALEGYTGSRILEAESGCCSIHSIQEHGTYSWAFARQLGWWGIEMHFEMLLSVN
jgi:hypothetical protein